MLYLLFGRDSEPVAPGSFVEVEGSTDESEAEPQGDELVRATEGVTQELALVQNPVAQGSGAVAEEVAARGVALGGSSRPAVSTTSCRMASLLKRKLAVASTSEAAQVVGAAAKKVRQDMVSGEGSVPPQEASSV